MDLREGIGGPEIEVKWYGFPETTWEPLRIIYEDCEDMVREFIEKRIKDGDVYAEVWKKRLQEA